MASREDRVLIEFCSALSNIEGRVTIQGRPDKDRPGAGGCDALIDRGGLSCALEHTTIDLFENQRADSHRFRTVIVPVEAAVQSAYPDFWIEITIIVPTHAVPTGQDWRELSQRLAKACVTALADVPIQRKSEGLSNGKKQRTRKLLIQKDIHVFAICLARAKITDPHCTAAS